MNTSTHLLFVALVATICSVNASLSIGSPSATIETDDNIGKYMVVNAGDDVTLLCSVREDSGQNANWVYPDGTAVGQLNGGLTLATDQSIRIELSGGITKYYLELRAVRAEDAGKYICRLGSENDQLELFVTSVHPDITTKPTTTMRQTTEPQTTLAVTAVGTNANGLISAKQGATARLQCMSISTPKVLEDAIQWYFQDVLVSSQTDLLGEYDVVYYQLYDDGKTVLSTLTIPDVSVDQIGQYRCEFTSEGVMASAELGLQVVQESGGDINDGKKSLDGVTIKPTTSKPTTTTKPTDGCTIKPKRSDLTELGSPCLFRGWVDVQGQGANNDYCRVISNGGQPYLSCALAGSTDDHVYTSPNKTIDWFNAGHVDTWYMKDEDSDGRDDYCRCVGTLPNTVVSCMKAGVNGFISHDDFQIEDSSECHYKKVNPFFGMPPTVPTVP